MTSSDPLRLTIVALFLDEERYLARFLASMAAQTRRPDQLILVDDGSTDGSPAIAERFCEAHDWASVHHRPSRAKETDRLADAAELRAFFWGMEQARGGYDVIVKLDSDLDMGESHIETVMSRLEQEPGLGIAGTFQFKEVGTDLVREPTPTWHVRGGNKFYRRECFEAIRPIHAILGWDEFDEVKARMEGWRTESFDLPGRPTIHLRPTGMQDGRLRAYRRWGQCYWGFGMSVPSMVALSAWRLSHRPFGVASLNLLFGFVRAGIERRPRVEKDVRRFRQAEQRRRAVTLASRLFGRARTRPSA